MSNVCALRRATPSIAALKSRPTTSAPARAKANATQLLSANIATQLAREDTLQAKAALLPGVNAVSQYIYTQPNGASSGVFVSNDGPHIYNNQLAVHGDLYAPGKIADYRKIKLAEEIARLKVEITTRGLTATVVQNYYSMVMAGRRVGGGWLGCDEAIGLSEFSGFVGSR